jgi:hypothetical protein
MAYDEDDVFNKLIKTIVAQINEAKILGIKLL